MAARVSPRPVVFLVLLTIFLALPGCRRGISQYVTKPVPESRNVSVDEITLMAGRSLERMGYGIEKQDNRGGYIYSRKQMAEDAYGRSTEIYIYVQQGQGGEKILGVDAYSCPKCVPEGPFSPSWMADRFYANFDQVYTASGRSAEANPSPGKQTSAAEQPQPSLRIKTMEVKPDVVRAGSKFDIVLEYTVADPTMKEKELPVHFTFSIMRGSETLYSPRGVEIGSGNGGATKRTEPITASKRNGAYAVKVNLQYRGVNAEESRGFIIK